MAGCDELALTEPEVSLGSLVIKLIAATFRMTTLKLPDPVAYGQSGRKALDPILISSILNPCDSKGHFLLF